MNTLKEVNTEIKKLTIQKIEIELQLQNLREYKKKFTNQNTSNVQSNLEICQESNRNQDQG